MEPPSILPGELRADLEVPGTVDELYGFFQESLVRDGYEVIRTDYEGFEAEIYFEIRPKASGLVWILLGCGGRSSVVSIRAPEDWRGA